MAYSAQINRLRWLVAALIMAPATGNVALSSYVGSQTHYVSATATGADDGLTRETAWSVDQYRANAVAGNRVMFIEGDYQLQAVDDKWGSPLNPIHSGEPGNPLIVFCEYRAALLADTSPNRVVISVHGATASGGLTLRFKDNVYFEGFYTNEADYTSPQVPDGMVVGIHESSNCRISYCRVQILPHAGGSGFNHAALRLERTTNCHVGDNYVNGQVGGNTSCILIYGSKGYQIYHNLCIGGTNGIYLKGDNTPGAGQYLIEAPAGVYRNVIQDVANGIFVGGPKPASGQIDYTDIYCNIVRAATTCALRLISYDAISPRRVRVVNNTFEVTSIAPAMVFTQSSADLNTVLLPGSALLYCVVDNNIFAVSSASTTVRLIQCESEYNITMIERATWNNNSSFNTRTDSRYIDLSKDGTQLTPAGWQARGHQNVTTGDPLFVDSSAGDYRLQSSSPCAGNAPDILNLRGNGTSFLINRGAYIFPDQNDVMGVRAT